MDKRGEGWNSELFQQGRCSLQRRTRSCPSTKTFPHWNSSWRTSAKGFFVIAIHPHKQVCFLGVSHWNTQKFTQENWYKICYKAAPKQAAGPAQHHSPSVVSSVFPLLLKGQKSFGGKNEEQIGVSLCSLPSSLQLCLVKCNFQLAKSLLKVPSAALPCLFVLHLAPCP